MKVIGTANRWIQCRKPLGCGWYWQLRTVKDHWYSRPRDEVKGAFWEDEEGRPELSRSPDTVNLGWQPRSILEEYYSDCLSHLREVQHLDAVHNSADTHPSRKPYL
jgi:hypothetical protein